MENSTSSNLVSTQGTSLIGMTVLFSINFVLALVGNAFCLMVLRRESCGFGEIPRLLARLICWNNLALAATYALLIPSFKFRADMLFCYYGVMLVLIAIYTCHICLAVFSLERTFQVFNPYVYVTCFNIRKAQMVIAALMISIILYGVVLMATGVARNTAVMNFCRHEVIHEIKWYIPTYFPLFLSMAATTASQMCLLGLSLYKLRAKVKVQPTLRPNTPAFDAFPAVPNRYGRKKVMPVNNVHPPAVKPKAAPNFQVKRSAKCLRTVLTLVIAHDLMDLPMFLTLHEFFHGTSFSFWTEALVQVLFNCSCWWNCLILALTNRDFRAAAKLELQRLKVIY